MKTKIIYSLTITSMLLLTACGGKSEPSESATTASTSANDSTITSDVASNKTEAYVSPLPDTAPTYTVAMMEFAPYRFKDEYGNDIGYEVDLLHSIAEEAGFKVELKTESYANIFPSIIKGDNDIAMFSLTLTPERQKVMLASKPYSVTKAGYLVQSESPYKDFDSLSDKRIATLTNSPLQMELKEQGITNIVVEPTIYLTFQTIFIDKADAAYGYGPGLIYASQQFPDNPSRIIYNGVKGETAIYTGKDKQELMKKINTGLDAVMANGKYQQVYEKWFHEHASDVMIDKAKNH